MIYSQPTCPTVDEWGFEHDDYEDYESNEQNSSEVLDERYLKNRYIKAKEGNPPINENLEPIIYSPCENCAGISIENLTLPGGYSHTWKEKRYFLNEDLHDENCGLCFAIYYRGPLDDSLHWGRALILSVNPPGLLTKSSYLEVRGDSRQDKELFHRLLPLYTVEGDPAQELGIPLLHEWMSTSSDRAFETANHWLQACDNTHDCLSRGPWLDEEIERPARLIDLTPIGDKLDVRISETCKDGPWPKYSTLSYCWGSNPNSSYVTTKSTLQSIMKALSCDSLPLSIQHAIQASHKLGMRYLWVDALCIIQDSVEDWNIEAAKMGSIYAKSYITIAADSSQGAHDGLFHQRKDIQVSFYEVKNTLSDGRESVLYFPLKGMRYPPPVREPKEEPLAQRGWVLQERILCLESFITPRNVCIGNVAAGQT